MQLISDKIAQEAIVEAIMTIEEVSRLAAQAQELYEQSESGRLTESKRRLLKEDLNKAMKDLQTSSQASMGKIDQAIKFADMFMQVCSNAQQSEDDIWALLSKSFAKAKEIIGDFASMKLGGFDSVKAMFKDGGKYAAVMDNLASEMSILGVFIKVLSSGFAQAIRIVSTLPKEYKDDPNNKKGNVTLADYVNNDPAGQLDSAELENGIKTMMSDIQQKNGGYAFSMKGVKNFFKKNSGTLGMAALAGGLAALTGGLALPGILGALALGSAAKKKMTREPDDALGAYETSIDEVAAAMLRTQMSAFEAGVPLFVKAVKGASVEEFAKAAAEAQQTIQAITTGIDANDLLTKYIEEYGANAKAVADLYELDPAKTQSLFQNFMNDPDSLKGTTVYEDFINLKEKYLTEAAYASEDLLLEENELVHGFSITDLLFEDPSDESSRARRRRRAKKRAAARRAAAQPSRPRSQPSSARKKPQSANKPQDKKPADKKTDDKAAAKKKYQKAKATIKTTGKTNLGRAQKKPAKKAGYAQQVDQKERQLNKTLKDPNRKRQITKIADDFEKKIKAIDAEGKPGAEDKEDKNSPLKTAAAGGAAATAATVAGGDDTAGTEETETPTMLSQAKAAVRSKVADAVDDAMPEWVPDFAKDAVRGKIEGGEEGSFDKIEDQIEDKADKEINIDPPVKSALDQVLANPNVSPQELRNAIAKDMAAAKAANTAAAKKAEPAPAAKPAANMDALAKLPSLSDIFGAKKRTEKQDKFLSLLVGESITGDRENLLVESYDRRLLSLAGIK